MNGFMALTADSVQNIHAPLPLTAHIAFCIIATLLYIVQYKRLRLNYYIYMTIAVDLTLATQFFTENYVIMVLGIAEVILLVMAYISNRKYKKMLKENEEFKRQKEIMQNGEQDMNQLINKSEGEADDAVDNGEG